MNEENKSSDRRRNAREIAMQSAYALGDDLIGDLNLSIKETLKLKDDDNFEYSNKLLSALSDSFNQYRDEIMEEIDNYLNEPLDQISLTERVCLILALLEKRVRPDTPKAVIITEWVAISKIYGSPKGYRLINSVIDNIDFK